MTPPDVDRGLSLQERALIDAIITAYHTTRLSEVAAADHIFSKPFVRRAFATLEAGPLPEGVGVHPLDGKLENECRNMRGDAAAMFSLAISLKRIADVIDGTAAGLCVTETLLGGRREP